MAVATDREFRLLIGGVSTQLASGDVRELAPGTLDLYLETKSVIVSTGANSINPFGL